MSSPLYIEHAALLKEAGVVTKQFSEFETSLTKDDVLVIIDLQNDFFPADTVEDGGRFGVAVSVGIFVSFIGWRKDRPRCSIFNSSLC